MNENIKEHIKNFCNKPSSFSWHPLDIEGFCSVIKTAIKADVDYYNLIEEFRNVLDKMKIDKKWDDDSYKENTIYKIESFAEVIYIYLRVQTLD
jgi:hypothetical protein